MSAFDFSSLLASANVKAAMRVVREGESNQVDEDAHLGTPESAYRCMWHPTRRKYWAGPLKGPHPREFEDIPATPDPDDRSSAFGAFQFTWTRWQALNRKYTSLRDDISPFSQDLHFVASLHDLGALDDVLDGRFDKFVRKCGREWASLPHSSLNDGGSKMLYARARAVWDRWGGNIPTTVATTAGPRSGEPAPIEERSIPAREEDVARIEAETRAPAAPAVPPVDEQESPAMSPALFLMPLLQSLFEAFSPLLRAKVTKALDKQTGDPAVSAQVADRVLDIVKGVAGQSASAAGVEPRAAQAAATDPLVAVATVKTDPKLLAAVEAQVSDYLEQIAPMLDRLAAEDARTWAAEESSRNAAAERARGEAFDPAAVLTYSGLAGVGAITLFVCVAITVQLARGQPVGTEMWAALTGLIGWITAKAGTIYDYRFGTSRTAAAKDVVIAELTQRRP